MKFQILLSFLFIFTIHVFAQKQSKGVRWINHSETINNGYTVQFKYPNYFKYDWIENGLCLGVKEEKSGHNNTMDWGIWMDDPSNYEEVTIKGMYFKEYDVMKKDTIVISGYKGVRTVLEQKHGDKYYEEIAIIFSDVVFTVSNSKKQSVDFMTFYKSIFIKRY